MAEAWQVFRKTLSDLWDEMYLLVVVNVLWVALSVLLVTGPPATAGLFVLTHRLALRRGCQPARFFRGLPTLLLAELAVGHRRRGGLFHPGR